jgi:hypothetical protein
VERAVERGVSFPEAGASSFSPLQFNSSVALTSRAQGPAQHAFIGYLCAAIALTLAHVMEFSKYIN